MSTNLQRLIEIAKRQGFIRPRDLATKGIPREYLIRLCKRGTLTRVGRGIYALPERPVTEHHSLALVAKQTPKAIICLLSALRYHGLTSQEPHEVWIALGTKAFKPVSSWPPIRLVRFSGEAFHQGVERHLIEGVDVKIYSAAKTVADCFKYRNKIGIDIATQALRDVLRQKKASVDEVYEFAKICRVARVIRPYLEVVA